MASSAGIGPSAPLVGSPGNWPPPAQLVNLDIDDNARYGALLNFMIEAINRSLLGYTAPDEFGTSRWSSILSRYNAQRATLLPNERPISTARSLTSAWSRKKREMLRLIGAHNARIGATTLTLATPPPVTAAFAAPVAAPPIAVPLAASPLILAAPVTIFSFNSVY